MNKIICGDALATLKTLESGIVQTCVTSPPYYGLRSYIQDGHPDKPLEIGLEESPEAYIARLVEVFREVKRVLRDDGTLWVNLGSSYVSGIIESEEYVMRDDLTEEETAYVYAELAKHFTRQSQTVSEMQQAHASPEQDMQELLHRAEVATRELCGEDM